MGHGLTLTNRVGERLAQCALRRGTRQQAVDPVLERREDRSGVLAPPLHHLFGGEYTAVAFPLNSQLFDLAFYFKHLTEVVLHCHARECAAGRQLGDLQCLVEVRAVVLKASEMLNSQLRRDKVVELEPIGQQLPADGPSAPINSALSASVVREGI
jgi:hypothetical protein